VRGRAPFDTDLGSLRSLDPAQDDEHGVYGFRHPEPG
jgi:hypothetical protein